MIWFRILVWMLGIATLTYGSLMLLSEVLKILANLIHDRTPKKTPTKVEYKNMQILIDELHGHVVECTIDNRIFYISNRSHNGRPSDRTNVPIDPTLFTSRWNWYPYLEYAQRFSDEELPALERCLEEVQEIIFKEMPFKKFRDLSIWNETKEYKELYYEVLSHRQEK
jgi:hypothetical protein